MPRTPSPDRYSPGKTQQARAEAVRDIVSVSADLLQKSPDRINLHDVNAVKAVAESMMQRCANAGVLPSVEMLAACCGLSRRRLYRFIAENPESKTTEMLDKLRTAFAACRIAAADRGAADASVSIFLLLNSDLGFTNEHRLEISQPQNGLEIPPAEIEKAKSQILSAVPDYDENEKE